MRQRLPGCIPVNRWAVKSPKTRSASRWREMTATFERRPKTRFSAPKNADSRTQSVGLTVLAASKTRSLGVRDVWPVGPFRPSGRLLKFPQIPFGALTAPSRLGRGLAGDQHLRLGPSGIGLGPSGVRLASVLALSSTWPASSRRPTPPSGDQQ